MDDITGYNTSIASLGITNNIIVGESTISSTLLMSPVLFEYRGSYMCIAEYNETSFTFDSDRISDNFTLLLPRKQNVCN